MSTLYSPAEWRALAEKAIDRCAELALDSEHPHQLTRTFCSPAMQAAHQRVATWMEAAGLEHSVDPVCNLVGRDPLARTPGKKRLLIGSHLDTIPNAGRFDGALGIMIGLAATEALRDTELPFGLEIIAFSDEEGVRYTSPYLGSRGIAGTFDYGLLDRADDAGITVAEALAEFGLDADQIPHAKYDPSELVAFVEAHIEQGPVLDNERLPVGLVTAFAGQTRMKCAFHGRAGHAGTVPMNLRHDALVAASRFAIAVDEHANKMNDLRATIGSFQAYPGASNVIPESVKLTLDVRHADDATRMAAVEELLSAAQQIAESSQTRFEITLREEQPGVRTDRTICDILADNIRGMGCKVRRLISGAGHDSLIMASLTPTAMLFVRNTDGISHHPDERVALADVEIAIRILVGFVKSLGRQLA